MLETKSLEEALTSEHGKHWKDAVDSEYESLMKNKTWKLVELKDDWLLKVLHSSMALIMRRHSPLLYDSLPFDCY